jgi:hypothetical protein
MKGAEVHFLSAIVWKQRNAQLRAKDEQGVLAKWFEMPRATVSPSVSPVKK